MAEEHPAISFRGIFEQDSHCWAFIPSMGSEPLDIKLEGVDQGGIWIQCQRVTDMILRELGQSSFPATPVVFVPYSAIRYAFVLAEGPSLSAEKLGLAE